MPKKKKILIKDIRSFNELKQIETIVIREFKGIMPINVYNRFLKVITTPAIRIKFILKFSSKIKKNNYLPQKPQNKKREKISENYIKKTNKPDINKTIISVKPEEFSFQSSIEGPKLVYKGYKTFFLGKKEWFNSKILKSIKQSFNITIHSLSLYSDFSFVPMTDKQVFENLLKEKYLELSAQIEKEELERCDAIIERYIKQRVEDYLNSFHKILIKTNIKNFILLKRKQIYKYQFNVLDYIKTADNFQISIPLSTIMELVQDEGYERFNNIVSEKWKNGYVKTFDLKQVFPNFSKSETSIIIPKIFIDRFGNDEPIEIKIIYSENEGIFNCKLNSYIKGYNYNTETSAVIYNDDIRISLRNILRKIKDKFIITFYTSYIMLFNEGDNHIHAIFEQELNKFNYDDNLWSYISERNRFVSGLSGLQYFDKANNKDWMWLTEQLKRGKIKEAFVFRDSDQTYSSKLGYTVKYPVKVYVTMSDDRYKRTLISMYALDTQKSIYRFSVEEDKKYEAVFFVWSYFSSNNYNKRQDFDKITHHFKDFGINYFYKDSPLEYRSGIGYCERDWLNES